MKDLLERVFEGEFAEDNYRQLIVNLFNGFDFSSKHSLAEEFNESEKQHIKDFLYLGSFDDSEKKNLDVLMVKLKADSKVERARSLQRNLIGKHLKRYSKDAALVAFYSEGNPDWRLSFVKMDFKFTDKGAKVEVGTPPKRYSFLVGKSEPSYTAKKQFEPLLSDKVTPNIDEIEQIFSIEKVTKEFYVDIARMFTELVGGERKIGAKTVKEKARLSLPSTRDDIIRKEFAVRLIGRLLFCWFLKKKKSESGEPLVPSVLISSDAVKQEKNYYHSYLEPLFFQVLNTPQENRRKVYNQEFWKMIPFLNGGLFEPHDHDYYEPSEPFGHSKHINTLKIPDKWFLELFEIFELYNFTIDESTSIDVDISVDPEMLGRIFENLLAEINPETGETARKSTGSYYTPRPIVEYMVDESLKQYLKIQTDIDEDKLANLLSFAEDGKDFSEKEIDAIIDALDKVKIIDPACGSGAFPMGILHKMLLILQKIDRKAKKWLERKIKDVTLRKIIEKKLKDEQWDYFRKLGIIRDSIYGVDIQPIAVEISKLRFFLSLVVDEKINDDHEDNRGVEALPNLEFKFVAANSLVSLPKSEGGLAESHSDIAKLRELRESYFISSGKDKKKIENEFKNTQHRMFEHSLGWMTTDSQTFKLSEWNPFSESSASWFDAEWMFGITSGFDIVIANPPYIQLSKQEGIDTDYKDYLKGKYNTSGGRLNTFIFFLHEGYNILKQNGALIYIIPNTLLTQIYYKYTREFILRNATINAIVNYDEMQFSNAVVENITLQLNKAVSDEYLINILKHDESGINLVTKKRKTDLLNEPNYSLVIFDNPIIEKAFNLKHDLLDTHCNINQAIALKGDKSLSLTKKASEGDYKLLDGRNINKYEINWDGVYLKYDLKRIHSCKRKDIFESMEKLFFRRVSTSLIFTYDNSQYFALNTLVVLNMKEDSPLEIKYLLAILNSKLLNYIYVHKFKSTKKVFSEIQAKSVGQLPIIVASKEVRKQLCQYSDSIISKTRKGISFTESSIQATLSEIDNIVYSLYELNKKEIELVEEYYQ